MKNNIEKIINGIKINYHASIKIEKDNKIIYFDPFKIEENIIDADYIFITHSHYDHYSEEDIKKVMKKDTVFVITSDLESKIKKLGIDKEKIIVVIPDRKYSICDIEFSTVKSYNINKEYHKKEYNWVGYILNIKGIYYYIVGDSDVIDELKNIKCDCVFVPVGGTYTMDYKEAQEFVNKIKPLVAIPIHYGEVGSLIDAKKFIESLDENIHGVIL